MMKMTMTMIKMTMKISVLHDQNEDDDLAAATFYIDKDEEREDSGGDHGGLHGWQHYHCKGSGLGLKLSGSKKRIL